VLALIRDTCPDPSNEYLFAKNYVRCLQAAGQRSLDRTHVSPAVERFTGIENRSTNRP
jgi:hypothetical protein